MLSVYAEALHVAFVVISMKYSMYSCPLNVKERTTLKRLRIQINIKHCLSLGLSQIQKISRVFFSWNSIKMRHTISYNKFYFMNDKPFQDTCRCIRGLTSYFKVQSFYLRNAKHLKIENELHLLFEVNTFDRKDEVQPELRTNGD